MITTSKMFQPMMSIFHKKPAPTPAAADQPGPTAPAAAPETHARDQAAKGRKRFFLRQKKTRNEQQQPAVSEPSGQGTSRGGWFGRGKRQESTPIAPLGLAHDATFQGLLKQLKPLPPAPNADAEAIAQAHVRDDAEPAGPQLIDPKTKEVRPELLGDLSVKFKHFLDGAADSLGAKAAGELRTALDELARLGAESLAAAGALERMTVAEDRMIAEKMAARFLGEAVRDCYARAADICEAHAGKAGKGSERQNKLAAMTALFTELKRHHLSASATPAFEAFTKAEIQNMKGVNPGMVSGRSGAALSNTKALSVDIAFGKDKITKADPLKITGEAGLEFEAAEELSVDDDGDQNRWDKRSLTGRIAAIFDGGILGGKIAGKLKVSMGSNYAESGSFPEQTKIYGRQKADESYMNRLSDSANPTARNLKNWSRSAQKVPKTLTLADYTSVTLPVHLTEQKVAKGAQNTGAIHAMARKVGPELEALMNDAYLPLQRPMAYGAMSVPAGGTGQRGKEKTTSTVVEGVIEGSMKALVPDVGEDYLSVGMSELKGAMIGRRKEFSLERLKPSHVHLSTAYTKDMRKSLDLWKAIETSAQTDTRLASKLAQYHTVTNRIARATGGHDPETPYDAALFGPVTDIPKAYLDTILAPEETLEELARAISEECDRLGRDYDVFQRNAGLLNAVPEKRASDPVKAQYATLHGDAYGKITGSSWAPPAGAGASHLEELISSPAKRGEFLADGYDALSTALAGAGSHLEILKMRLSQMDDVPPELARSIMAADASYGRTNAALVQAELPLHEDTLHRYNTIAWTSVSAKNELEMQATLTAGAQPDLVSNLMDQQDTEANLSLDTGVAGLTATLAWKNVTARHQNVARSGDFREWSLTLGGGGPLGGAAVERLVLQALHAMRKDGGADITPSERDGLRDALKTAASAGALDKASNIVLTWKHHKYSKAGDDAYRQQYFRISEQDKHTFAPSVAIPLDAAAVTKVKAGVRSTQEMKYPIFEMMGTDLSHHILSLVRLDELQTKAKNKAAEAEAETSPLDLLRAEFEAEPYRKNQFFSSMAILDVVKEYKDFLAWKSDPIGHDRPNSGFVFFDLAEIQDLVRNARQAEGMAAGKQSFTIDEESGEVRTERRASLSDPLDIPMEQLEAFDKKVEERIEEKRRNGQEARLTPDDRADLFLGTPEGKAVFQSYTKLISTYKELSATASTLAGWDGHLREDEPDWQRTKRIATSGKNAAAALMDIAKGTGLRPSPGGGDAATRVLDQRGYFAGEPSNHDELWYDRQSQAQTDAWLARHGLAKAENKLTGIHSLVVAHLQHATGDYGSLHVREAAEYVERLGGNEPSEAAMRQVVEAINSKHGAVQARMIAPNDENNGAPVWTGDLGASEQPDARSVVILRGQNSEGGIEFSAVVRLKAASGPDIPEHLKKLDGAVDMREKIVGAPGHQVGHDSGLTGTQLRAAMAKLGVERGPLKTMTAKAADGMRPERKALRELDDTRLRAQAATAARLQVGGAGPWREAVKELKKRDDMRDLLTAAATGRPAELKTGKELRTGQRRDGKTAEVMARLNLGEVAHEAEQALNPKVKAAAVEELRRRAGQAGNPPETVPEPDAQAAEGGSALIETSSAHPTPTFADILRSERP
ncbi:hypothetical protein [Pseudoduganella namucuonensis]|uniref:Uncharacterized protein n=1 Tax=Pseudoduganella namucuonensis TaxID=1035707 RepID=A0A1I7HNY9_9BURK|nr:hypothetical protein [Pseudoduganella namucuonensis]SFU62440.1 hypothetical protein SAMN05216552_100679 [Pseudoduganella namucuonensis]